MRIPEMRQKKISKTPKTPPHQDNRPELTHGGLPQEPVQPRHAQFPIPFETQRPLRPTLVEPDDSAIWAQLMGRPPTAADLYEIDNNVLPLIQLLLELQDSRPAQDDADSTSWGSDVE
jgi:hypothetical protein